MKNIVGIVLSAALFLFALSARAGEGSIVVIAHRGNHEQAHENTIEAIRDAIRVGADYVELDVRRTSDKEHVLSHDRSLKRMTGVERAVSDLTLAEIRELKVRDLERPAIAVSRIPTLEEALQELGTKIGLYLDFKEGDPAQIASAIRRHGMTNRVVVYLDVEKLPAWHAVAPEFRFIVSVPDASNTPERLPAFLKKYSGVVLDGPANEYTAELVRVAHREGAKVWPDIQNPNESPEQWSKALDLGVDGLQTDHPSALIAWLKKVGRR